MIKEQYAIRVMMGNVFKMKKRERKNDRQILKKNQNGLYVYKSLISIMLQLQFQRKKHMIDI